MGLFSSIGSIAKSVGTAVKNAGVVVAQSTGIAKLWGDTAKPTVNPSVAKIPIVGTAAKILVEHPYTSALAVATPITSLGKTAGTTFVKAVTSTIIKKPITSAVVASIAVPAIAGAIAKNPGAAAEKIAAAPSSIANFEKNIFTAVKEPTLENILAIPKENPILTALGVGVPLAAAAKVISVPAAIAASQILNKDTTIKTETPEKSIATISAQPSILTSAAVTPSAAPSVPITPATAPLIATAGTSTSRKRKRASIRQVMPSMRQNLSVIVQNRNQNLKNETIINREVLAN